jgi:hypothetical protein
MTTNLKKNIGFVTTWAIDSLIAVNVHSNNERNALDISLVQIEAPANDERTVANYCYKVDTSTQDYELQIPCNSKTNASTIYPCKTPRYDYYETKGRCIK